MKAILLFSYKFLLLDFYFDISSLCLISSFYLDSLDSESNCFIHKSSFKGVKFPDNGPVKQKKTTNWEPSIEKMTVRDGILKGDVTMFLSLTDGGNHRCQFSTSYKYVFKVSL